MSDASSKYALPSPELVREIKERAERPLTPEAFEAYVDAPWAEGEKEELLDFIAWFVRRYPKPEDRLRWLRNAYRSWSRPSMR